MHSRRLGSLVWSVRASFGALACGVLMLLVFACDPGRAQAQGARVSMSTSSNRVAVGEPFAIEIRIETHGDEPDSVELPDFGQLQVLGRSTARPFSFSFGFGGGQRARVKSETVYGFTLRAVDMGAYAIRPAIITVNGRRVASQPLNIIVVDPANQGIPGARNPQASGAVNDPDAPPPVSEGKPIDGAKPDSVMFLRTVVDKKTAFLGEQVTVTIYLYLRGQLGDSPSITREPTLDGFWSNDLLPMQRSLSATRQELEGHTYSVYVLRRFAAFPLRTGRLDIGAPAVEVGAGGSIFDLLNGPARPTRREGVKVSVEVLPLPAQPNPQLPSFTGTLALEASLDSPDAKVGEAVTLRVQAKGHGNLRGLSLATPTLAQIDTLAPEIDDKVGLDHELIGGERSFRWLLLPRAAGTFTIPSFAVDVFDAASRTYQTARSAPLSLRVSGAKTEDQPALDEIANADPSARFGPARGESELLRRASELDQRAFYWPSVLAAPCLLVLLFLVRLLRRRLAARQLGSRDSRELREVDGKLEAAERASQQGDAGAALSALASALKKAIELRLGEPVGGMTLRALETHLTSHAFDPKLSARVLAQLGALERARFDPGAQGAIELGQALTSARLLIKELARGKRDNKSRSAA